jgi:hypothetical protein
MPSDIDQITESLRTEVPGTEVAQLQVTHPGTDDNGVWFITIPGRDGEVQIESSNGGPILIGDTAYMHPLKFGTNVYRQAEREQTWTNLLNGIGNLYVRNCCQLARLTTKYDSSAIKT